MKRSELASLGKVIGQTKSAGFEIGARRTFAIPVAGAWELVTSEAGVRIWLGEPTKSF